ncbi:MAG: hypothetical protein J6X94_03750 [Lachnospiraceae bacterium]|nr:hypothetical protein [Lachnospiraceae bacterium]
MHKFKISNTSNAFASVIMISSFLLGAVLSLAYVGRFESSAGPEVMFGFIFIFLGIVVGMIILYGRNADVEYDGYTIKLKSFFGKKEIDLSKIKTVSYEYVKGYGRGAYDTICVTFVYSGESDDLAKYDSLHDTVNSGNVDNIFKGDYTGFPLMQMYEDIVRRYPEKKG